MTIRIINDGPAAPRRFFGRRNHSGAQRQQARDGGIDGGDAEAEAGGGGGVGVGLAGVDFEDDAGELAGVVLGAGAVGVLGEGEAEGAVEAARALDVGGADDDEVEGDVAHYFALTATSEPPLFLPSNPGCS